jgi:ATP-dependent Lhr-like helicase
MMSAVERLTLSAGELSAHRPVGHGATSGNDRRLDGRVRVHGPDASYRPRPVRVVRAADRRSIALTVRTPDVEVAKGPDAADLWWEALAGELKKIIEKNRSTLVFANSRRTVEKIARLLNAGESEPIAYSHHGSCRARSASTWKSA